MKKIYIALFALLAVGSTFTACTAKFLQNRKMH